MALADLILQHSKNQPNYVNTFQQARANSMQQQLAQQQMDVQQADLEKQRGLSSLLPTATPESLFKSGYADEGLKLAQIQKTQQEKPEKDNQFKYEKDLRKEFDDHSKDFIKVRDAHTRVLKAAEDPSAAGDLAVIFNYMKVLDPGSTVREGEFATAQNSAGVDQRIRSLYNQVIDGTRLTAPQRVDFVDRSGRLYTGQLDNQKAIEERYTTLSQRNQVDPQNVVFEYRLPDGTSVQKKDAELTAEDFNKMSVEELREYVNNHPSTK